MACRELNDHVTDIVSRHVTPKGQSRDPQCFQRNISKMAGGITPTYWCNVIE